MLELNAVPELHAAVFLPNLYLHPSSSRVIAEMQNPMAPHEKPKVASFLIALSPVLELVVILEAVQHQTKQTLLLFPSSASKCPGLLC